jgi:hypothetical protein
MKSVAKMPAVAFAGVAAILAVLLFAPIRAAASTNEDDVRKQFDEKLDHYAAQAKDVTQRSQKQVQQLQNDASTLLDRWASEVANKQLAQYPEWANKYTGTVSCTQPVGPQAAIPGQRVPIFSPVPISSFYVDPPARKTATYSSEQFEAWKKVELGFFEQSQKQLDANLKYFLAILDDRRKRADQLDQEATQPNKGVNWRASQYQGLLADMLRHHDPNHLFTDAYIALATAYAELLYLHASEISGSDRRTETGLLAPPGQKCLIDFQQSSPDNTDYSKAELARQSEIVTSPEQKPPKWGLVCDKACQALRAKCASDEQTRRDTAASQFRSIRDRYYAERPPIRDRLLAWRKEAVAAGFYEGTGDADAAVVYGKESDLSPDNVYSLNIPFDRPGGVYFLHIPRSHAQSALDYENKQVDSGWELGPLIGHVIGWDQIGGAPTGKAHTGIGEISIYLNTECIRETSPAGSHLTAKYPDLEIENPFSLEIPPLPRTDVIATTSKTPPQPRIFLYAVCNDGFQAIDHAFMGVPMIVEAQFDPPSKDGQVTLDVSFGGHSTKVTVTRFDDKGYIFRSGPLIPQGGSGQAPLSNPGSPPRTVSR